DTQPLLLGAPEVQFVSSGQPALDCCPQLTVHAISVTEAGTQPAGLMGGRRNVTGRITLVRLVVAISRCVPVQGRVGAPPNGTEQQAAASQTTAAAWALWNHLWNLWTADELFSCCGEVFWDGLRALPQNGGCGGWSLTLRASLDGYNESSTS